MNCIFEYTTWFDPWSWLFNFVLQIMQSIIRKFLVFFISFFPIVVAAQQPLQYSFYHITTMNGLLSNNIQSIVQDKDGYIWIASTVGLQRYDGIRFKTFRHVKNDSTSIASNLV